MDIASWGPEHWSALAAWATVLVAVVAGLIALLQVRESRRLREEQARPYVVVYMESNTATPHIVDLVVRNFGTTVAYDVKIDIDPPPLRSAQGGGSEDVWLFNRLPALVPGQEWRTMWDFGPSRFGSGLPDEYRAVARYRDSRGHELPPLPSALDWGAFRGRRWVTEYGVHDAAKALREIEKRMRRWSEGFNGLSVYARDGDALDARRRDELAKRDAEREPPPEG